LFLVRGVCVTDHVRADLNWEDAAARSGRWWIARAKDVSSGVVRDFFIAEDDMTDSLIGLLRYPPQSHYTVLAATFLEGFESRAAASAALKSDMAAVLSGAETAEAGRVRRALGIWRLRRAVTIGRKNLPFLLLGVLAGALLGVLIALFATSTGFVGWPMVAVGVVLGAATGPLLKLLVEHYRAKAVAGPWGRFAIIALGAIAGAGITAGGALLVFWH
jgi:hypothetical protein